MYCPELARRSEKCAGPVLMSRAGDHSIVKGVYHLHGSLPVYLCDCDLDYMSSDFCPPEITRNSEFKSSVIQVEYSDLARNEEFSKMAVIKTFTVLKKTVICGGFCGEIFAINHANQHMFIDM